MPVAVRRRRRVVDGRREFRYGRRVLEVLSWVWAVGAVAVGVWVVAEVARRLDFHHLRARHQLSVAVFLAAMIVAAYFSWRGFGPSEDVVPQEAPPSAQQP